MKKKIMLHIIMPDQVSGPNNSAIRIAESYLNEQYEFGFLTQKIHAGGKINVKLIRDLIKQINEFKPDVLHLSGLQSSGFHAVIAARLAGYSKIFLTIRGFAFDTIGLSKIKSSVFQFFIEPLTLFLSRKISIVTKESLTKKMVTNISKDKYVGVIHNAAPKVEFDVEAERAKLRKDLGFSDKDFIVIIVGRMVYDKGVSYVAEAAKRNKNSAIKFVFVGDGPYHSNIQSEYSNEINSGKIHLLGKRDNVLRLLSIADVFLFATLHENLSNALLEAMSIGLPIVCTSVGGNLEVIKDNENGVFIRPENSEDINEKINYLYNFPEVQLKLKHEAEKTIYEQFSQEIIYDKINKVYQVLLK